MVKKLIFRKLNKMKLYKIYNKNMIQENIDYRME